MLRLEASRLNDSEGLFKEKKKEKKEGNERKKRRINILF